MVLLLLAHFKVDEEAELRGKLLHPRFEGYELVADFLALRGALDHGDMLCHVKGEDVIDGRTTTLTFAQK